jgi:hypothetical protein
MLVLSYALLRLANFFHCRHDATVRRATRTSENTSLLGDRKPYAVTRGSSRGVRNTFDHPILEGYIRISSILAEYRGE